LDVEFKILLGEQLVLPFFSPKQNHHCHARRHFFRLAKLDPSVLIKAHKQHLSAAANRVGITHPPRVAAAAEKKTLVASQLYSKEL
jgi:hypothetical protein